MFETMPNYGLDKNSCWEDGDPADQMLGGTEFTSHVSNSIPLHLELAKCLTFFYLDQGMEKSFPASQRQPPRESVLVAHVTQVLLPGEVMSHCGVRCYNWT